jgi:hypothetical protein
MLEAMRYMTKTCTLQLSSRFTISLVGVRQFFPIPPDGGGGEGTTLNPNCQSVNCTSFFLPPLGAINQPKFMPGAMRYMMNTCTLQLSSPFTISLVGVRQFFPIPPWMGEVGKAQP